MNFLTATKEKKPCHNNMDVGGERLALTSQGKFKRDEIPCVCIIVVTILTHTSSLLLHLYSLIVAQNKSCIGYHGLGRLYV